MAKRSIHRIDGRAKRLALLFAERGSKTRLAAALGLRKQALSCWREVPVNYVIELERLTGVSRTKLRPDLYEGLALAE